MINFKADYVDSVLALRCTDDNELHVVSLWSVIVIVPYMGLMETHYVLACTAEGAVSMAKCAMGCASYETPTKLHGQITTYVTKLPLTIQGWGKAEL